MAVFTALRNKAQSGLAGLVTGAFQSPSGLNKAAGLRFKDTGNSRPISGDTGNMYQYPLDLGSIGNSHFISFFVRERKPAKVTQTSKKNVNTTAKKSEQVVDEDGAPTNSTSDESQQLTTQLKQSGNCIDMIWNPNEILCELSKDFDLEAGDLIFTGTPNGVGDLEKRLA